MGSFSPTHPGGGGGGGGTGALCPALHSACLFLPVLFPTSFDRELIAELWDYVCISKSFFLSWKVSSSKLGFPLHPLSPGVNPPFAGRVCLVSAHQNPRDKKKREEDISTGKSVFSVLCLLTPCCRKALFNCIFNSGLSETSPKRIKAFQGFLILFLSTFFFLLQC